MKQHIELLGLFILGIVVILAVGDIVIAKHAPKCRACTTGGDELLKPYKITGWLKSVLLLLIGIVLLSACKKEEPEPIKPNIQDYYSGRYVDNMSDTLNITLLSTSPEKNTYSILGLSLMVKKQFGDSVTVTGSTHTGYILNNASLYINGIASGSDGYSYVRINYPHSLGYGNYSRTLTKIP